MAMADQPMAPPGAAFSHSSLGVWLVATWCLVYLVVDSYQSILDKYHLVRRWWWFSAVLAYCAWSYVRPYVRVGLGSASKPSIRFTVGYLGWLCGAVFYHLPKLEAMGFEIRADLSVFIVTLISTFCALVCLWGLHSAMVRVGLLRPQVSTTPEARTWEIVGVLILNSATLALACSSYHSVCGNGLVPGSVPGAPPSVGTTPGSAGQTLRNAICGTWLHPVPTAQYPRLAAWMLYGEGTQAHANITIGNATTDIYDNQQFSLNLTGSVAWSGNSTDPTATLSLDALSTAASNGGLGGDSSSSSGDSSGAAAGTAGSVLSPVLTMWCTLMLLYIANSVADHAAASTLHAVHMNELRREVAGGSSIWKRYGQRSFREHRHTTGQLTATTSTTSTTLDGTAATGAAGTSTSGSTSATATPSRSKPPRPRGPLEVKKTISKVSSSPGLVAVGAAFGRKVLRSTPMQTLIRDTEWLSTQATELWDMAVGGSGAAADSGSGGGRWSWDGGSFGGGMRRVGSTGLVGLGKQLLQPSLGGWVGHVMGGGAGAGDGRRAGGGGTGRAGGISEGGGAGAAVHKGGGGGGEPEDEPQPDFLPMVPWYSGTSADMLKTCLDVIVSFKLFLGRFDMRTMQAATGSSLAADGHNQGYPAEGDGFTFEQYENREELWLDFMADTGDGGNSTYTLARTLAATAVAVTVPPSLQPALAGTATAAAGSQTPAGLTAAAQSEAAGAQKRPLGGSGGSKGKGKGGVAGPAAAAGAATGGAAGDAAAPAEGSGSQAGLVPSQLVLPRAEVLLVGGDLAYPGPTKETYEQRLLRPFQDAMPPPPHHHPERLVVHKPDLPPAWGVQEAVIPGSLRGLSPRASRNASAAALRSYPGPACFAIPGNHDWIDGLETFINYIEHKGWLGGWLLPQEKSYFAIKLPHGWWLFGLDLGLNEDIDMCQLRYFVNVVEQRLAPDDNVIIMTHQPMWLIEWFWHKLAAPHMRQLIRGHLRGRARVHLAGDLHFYMRHSFVPPQQQAQPTSQLTPQPSAVGPGTSSQRQAAAAAAQSASRQQVKKTAQPQPQPAVAVAGTAAGQPAVAPAPAAAASPAPSVTSSLTTATSAPSPTKPPATATTTTAATNPINTLPHSSSTSSIPSLAVKTRLPPAGPAAVPVAAPATAQPAVGSGPSQPPLLGSSPSGGNGWQFLAAAQGPPSSIVGGSSDDESESGLSVASGRSSRRRFGRSTSNTNKPVGIRAFGRQLPAICVQEFGWLTGSGGGGVTLPPTALGAAGPARCEGCLARARELQHHTFDPEHLIVNGAGGAFLHPTHIFAPATFCSAPDPAAEATAALYSAAQLPCTCRVHAYDPREAWGGGAAGFNTGWDTGAGATSGPTRHPSQRASQPPTASRAGAPAPTSKAPTQAPFNPTTSHTATNSTPAGTGTTGGQSSVAGSLPVGADSRGHYQCKVSYPSPNRSMELGRKNLHVFRLKNTRFDVIGGMLYFLLVLSVMPRCSRPGMLGSALLTLNHPPTITTTSHQLSANASCTVDASFSAVDAAAASVEPTRVGTCGGVGAGSALVGGVAGILDADTLPQMVVAAAAAYMDTITAIFTDSYVSLAVVIFLFLVCVGLARSGGVGTVREEPASGVHRPHDLPQKGLFASHPHLPQPPLKLRWGGLGSQLLWGGCHTAAHLTVAVMLLLVLELGVEMCIRHEQLGKDGLHSLFRWYEQFESQHFPDPQGMRRMLQRITLGLYPGVIKAAMAVFDLPEVVAVTRIAVCGAGGSFAAVSRLQTLGYYFGMLAYYWLFATPAVGAVFGAYLYASVVWGGVHFDEAFASLRLPNYKSVTRMHITPEGDLEIFTLALDRVPVAWREDPRWRSMHGGGNPALPSHLARYPSRWAPHRASGAAATTDNTPSTALQPRPNTSDSVWYAEGGVAGLDGQLEGGLQKRLSKAVQGSAGADQADQALEWKLVDYLKVPRKRAL